MWIMVSQCGVSQDKKNNKIALTALGTDIGVPSAMAAPVAIQTILDFIQQKPDAYMLIHLFVKKRSEFNLYSKLFTDKIKPREKNFVATQIMIRW